jgi:hypothetical protein
MANRLSKRTKKRLKLDLMKNLKPSRMTIKPKTRKMKRASFNSQNRLAQNSKNNWIMNKVSKSKRKRRNLKKKSPSQRRKNDSILVDHSISLLLYSNMYER